MANPIEIAVAPIKAHAIDRAERDARAYVERILADLAAHDWSARAAAPFPKSSMSRAAYTRAKTKHDLYQWLTAQDQAEGRQNDYRFSNPMYRVRDEAKEARFIEEAKAEAAAQYDSFVAKLVGKIGETTAADLNGSHVWGYSVLTVTLPSGEVQRWKTQQIVNVSSLGKLFNQWPSRKVK